MRHCRDYRLQAIIIHRSALFDGRWILNIVISSQMTLPAYVTGTDWRPTTLTIKSGLPGTKMKSYVKTVFLKIL